MLKKLLVFVTVMTVGSLLNQVRSIADEATLSATDVRITALENGDIQVADPHGKPRLLLTGYGLNGISQTTEGRTASKIKLANGTDAIQVSYTGDSATSSAVKITGQFVVSANRVHFTYDIRGDRDTAVDRGMLGRKVLPSSCPETISKVGKWVRDTQGGVPYEIRDGMLYMYNWKGMTAAICLPDTNTYLETSDSVHLPAKRVEAGHFVAEGDIVLIPGRQGPNTVAAIAANRPIALNIRTDQPYNLWYSPCKRLPLKVEVANTSVSSKGILLSWWARNFQGDVVAQGSESKALPQGRQWDKVLNFPAPTEGILFVEVSVKAADTNIFARTNLAVLAPHKFSGPPETSIFGLSAYFDLPSAGTVQQLIKCIGVRHFREKQLAPEVAKELGIIQNYHSTSPGASIDAYKNEPAKKDEWIREQLKLADSSGATYWEFANEWNMGSLGTGATAEQYVNDWLLPIAKAKQDTGAKVGIMSMGLAGSDKAWITKIHEAGAWDRFDAFSLHTGRGNYVPDYPVGSEAEQPDYWNFLGTIRDVRSLLSQYGDKPLYVTECYASTQPNHWWKDTYRHAAENVVLSYALAKEEGVRVIDWYQLNDSVWYDQNGVNPDDPEYHYGLLNRDLSPKPSLLAYRTIAEALEGATFQYWMKFTDRNVKGLMFNTPRGPMTVMWYRGDGYILNKDHPPHADTFPAPEPWVNDWKSRVSVSMPASGSNVTEIDCIGQRSTIKALNGKADIVLDGAPRIYYGLAEGTART